MCTLYENIIKLCKARGVTGGKMCTDIGISKSTLTDLKAGRKKTLTISTARKIADYFGVSVTEITGEPERNPLIIGTRMDDVSISEAAWMAVRAAAAQNNTQTAGAIPGTIPLPEFRTVPLIGTIACGQPILADENLEGQAFCPENVSADFALRCKGDSMINARIFDGDIVYIRQQETVEDGQIAAVLIDEEATLKRVHFFQDRIVLEAANPLYPPIVRWGEDMAQVRIIGKAVAFTSTIL